MDDVDTCHVPIRSGTCAKRSLPATAWRDYLLPDATTPTRLRSHALQRHRKCVRRCAVLVAKIDCIVVASATRIAAVIDSAAFQRHRMCVRGRAVLVAKIDRIVVASATRIAAVIDSAAFQRHRKCVCGRAVATFIGSAKRFADRVVAIATRVTLVVA